VQAESSNGDVTVDFSYLTRFSGHETIDGVTVNYADIFLGVPGAGSIPDFIDAIALGDQAQNGGLAAGLYTVTASETSQAIWGMRTALSTAVPTELVRCGSPGKPGTARPRRPRC
jgi:hypothetical protein